MGVVPEDSQTDSRRPRSLRFGEVAELYERFRPGYPAELVADLVRELPGRRVLEVGAGTGKATRLLARHGLALTCLEPDPAMAAVLRRNLAGVASIQVLERPFEQWRPDGTFDGIVSAQAWHWADPASKWRRAAAGLRPGGLLALFWNHEHEKQDAAFDAVAAVYEAHGVDPEERPVGGLDEWDDTWLAKEIAEVPELAARPWRSYAWEQRYDPGEFASFLDTTSHHRLLEQGRRERIHADVVAAISRHGGELLLRRVTYLLLIDRR